MSQAIKEGNVNKKAQETLGKVFATIAESMTIDWGEYGPDNYYPAPDKKVADTDTVIGELTDDEKLLYTARACLIDQVEKDNTEENNDILALVNAMVSFSTKKRIKSIQKKAIGSEVCADYQLIATEKELCSCPKCKQKRGEKLSEEEIDTMQSVDEMTLRMMATDPMLGNILGSIPPDSIGIVEITRINPASDKSKGFFSRLRKKLQ